MVRVFPFLRSCALLATFSACSDSNDQTSLATDEVDEDFAASEKSDSNNELRVRVANTTVWADKFLTRKGDDFVFSGRSSRNLVDGMAFIFDDVYGQFSQTSARKFEVRWQSGEAAGLITGLDLFTRIGFVPAKNRPDGLTAHAVVKPRLLSFSGDGVWLSTVVKPIINAGQTKYRVSGYAPSTIFALRAKLGDESLVAKQIDDTHFEIDLSSAQIIATAGTDTTISVAANLLDGQHVKQARVGLRVTSLGLTAEDAYELWPPLHCDSAVTACLATLPVGTLDLASCGSSREVSVCAGQIGVSIDDSVLALAKGNIHASFGQSLVADASALVGSDRETELLQNAHGFVEERLESMAGRWYLDATARSMALTQAADEALDEVYARPLELTTPHMATAGDEVATRHVVADALLTYLSSQDFVDTEFGRPLQTLTKEFRTGHLAALRFFREQAEAIALASNQVVYIGNWLNPLVEITVDITTGQVTNVFFEID